MFLLVKCSTVILVLTPIVQNLNVTVMEVLGLELFKTLMTSSWRCLLCSMLPNLKDGPMSCIMLKIWWMLIKDP